MAFRNSTALGGAVCFVLSAWTAIPTARADTAADVQSDQSSSPSLDEIVVTARKREENLQDVPDAITAFTAATLENANVRQLGDFTSLVPNLNFRDGSAYSAGFFDLSMRGIGQAQQGWPAVAFIVDGVPADSPDALTSNYLSDVERIEVLRGPQSALYGAGAIAGAINVVTKRPTDTTEVEGRLAYGNGNDRQADAGISGALIPDKLFARISGDYRDFGGLITSPSNGIPLDFRQHRQVQARFIFDPVSNFEVDLRGSFVNERNGSTYEDNLPSVAYINDFNPLYNARRSEPWAEDRTFGRVALRMQLTLDGVAVTSITGYSKTNEHGFVDICYDDPNDPLYPRQPNGGITCLSGTEAYGSAALPGQAIENIFDSRDIFKSYTQDVRVESQGASPIQWLVGASGLRRDTIDGFNTLNILAPDDAQQVLFPDWDRRRDVWWGLYGQLSAKLQAWELTFDGRYDHQQYENTGYTNDTLSQVAPIYATNGTLVGTQVENATSFQPKGQVSYHVDQDRMAYLTVSRGFRAGYFDTGAYSVPEHTTNYEVGLKSEWWQRRLSTNVALFHIDYSDQQTSTNITTAPYRVPVTIPQTKINGAELESSVAVTSALTLSTGLAYLDARVADGTRSPAAPLVSGSVSAQIIQPVSAAWRFNGRADLTFHSAEYLQVGDTEEIPENRFLNLRAGFENGTYGIYGYGRNVTDTREAAIAGAFLGTHYLRYPNEPASYGIEMRANF